MLAYVGLCGSGGLILFGPIFFIKFGIPPSWVCFSYIQALIAHRQVLHIINSMIIRRLSGEWSDMEIHSYWLENWAPTHEKMLYGYVEMILTCGLMWAVHQFDWILRHIQNWCWVIDIGIGGFGVDQYFIFIFLVIAFHFYGYSRYLWATWCVINIYQRIILNRCFGWQVPSIRQQLDAMDQADRFI